MTESSMMKTSILKRAATIVALMFTSAAAFASEGGDLMHAGTDLEDKASLQRGAQLYANYCGSCHSLKYMRYSRMAEDLGLSEEQVMQNLNFSGAKFGEHMVATMPAASAEKWFGKAPPDLSVISRVRGSDWIYTYLKSFYLDDTRPLGWNNRLFANASMPNPLWEMQGLQRPVYTKKVQVDTDDKGKPVMGCEHGTTEADDSCIKELVVSQPGAQNKAQFDQTARDIAAFLEYVGEPVALKRQQVGVWVVLFLAFFTLMAWLLKREYWRDVH
ncbi:MAG: cytochrome c1 [Lysobacteraceae bacterium]|nr:MAG: cytochrome c1 [Xanthomonadaceae bacterium]